MNILIFFAVPDSPKVGRHPRTVNIQSRVCPVSPRAPRKVRSAKQPVSDSQNIKKNNDKNMESNIKQHLKVIKQSTNLF